MSNIEWTDKTWNPVSGCSKVSPGCKHCYAEKMAARLVKIGGKAAADYQGVIDERGRWMGTFRELPHRLNVPLRRKKPTTWFVNSMSDLFGEGVSFEYIAAVFGVMAACPQHRFQVLTKRARRMREWFEWLNRAATDHVSDAEPYGPPITAWERSVHVVRGRARILSNRYKLIAGRDIAIQARWQLPNIMIGVSAEDQDTWDECVPELIACPARWRFVSVEPLLGPILHATGIPGIDQVIIGCESRGSALGRPTKIEWIQDLGRQVLDAGAALFVKQADVCSECLGKRHPDDEETRYGGVVCGSCDGTGQPRKLRKDCPAVWIPGHGAQSWRQMPEGWR